MTLIRCLLLLLLAVPGPALGARPLSDDPFPALRHGPHAVGYRVSYLSDPARSFGPRTDLDGNPLPAPFSRPVQLHLWYPAERSERQAMRYREYVLAAAIERGLPEEEVLGAYKASPARRGADPAALDAHLNRETRAVRDPEAAPGRFPLILYGPSINSDPYENAPLFEFLASHGYVIASAPCLGFGEAETGRDVLGAEAQLGDMMFVLSRAWEEPFVDRGRLGALGFSWGGTSAVLLAMRHAGIEAVASLDGGHGFPEYRSVAEAFPWWNPQNLRAAFLHVVPAEEGRDLDFGRSARYADTYRWTLPGLAHRDFAGDFVVKYRLAVNDPASDRISSAFQEIGRRLGEFYDAYLKGDSAALARLREGETPLAGSEWTSTPALPPLPTPAQFDEIIESRGVAAAERRFREIRERDPEVVLFDESRLLKYAYMWGPERADDLLVLLRMNLEAYPRSADTHFWLAQVHLSREDHSGAAEALEKALSIDPGHERAARLLERVRAMDESPP